MGTLHQIPPRPAEAVSEYCAPQDAARKPLWVRLVNVPRCWLLRYKIRCSVRYLALCTAEGITTGQIIAAWRAELQDMRGQLRRLEGGAA